ncbi:hypothetical protein [Hymenobacter properus]|uniref:Uncharacterized protein n=1 Tax=Hymenobacter properus TaxID=2791026 RepID=A0A931BA64_9BACT|nr:hypothetical protein [Hymenobacter properus]MBF9140004.1 hypothetical protein [Hymenobacter properus]MBR7718811.1 hypothetical protein [Microvirga sp. SRT04]
MRRKLNQLIVHYEAERRLLNEQLNECVEEFDHGMAHRFSKGLFLVNMQLQTLYNLRDHRHDEKVAALRHIESLEKFSQQERAGHRGGYYAAWIADERKKLAEWEAQVRLPRPQTTAVAEALHKLLHGRITGFTLTLSRAMGLYLTFRLARRTLIITLPEVRRHREHYHLPKKRRRVLQRLGFRRYDQGDKLISFRPLATDADIGPAMSMLSYMAFELFYFREFDQESYLSYFEFNAE